MDIKFLITYRPELDINQTLHSIRSCLRLGSAKINTNLSKFINIKVDELSRRKTCCHELNQSRYASRMKIGDSLYNWQF